MLVAVEEGQLLLNSLSKRILAALFMSRIPVPNRLLLRQCEERQCRYRWYWQGLGEGFELHTFLFRTTNVGSVKHNDMAGVVQTT